MAKSRRGGAAATLKFEGAATIRQAADHAARLRAELDRARELALDLDGVTAADLSFIQLVEAARASCAARNIPLRLTAPADGALRDVLARGGFLDPSAPERTQFWIHTAEAP